MSELKITQCKGEGQGSCKRCDDRGKWNRVRTSMLYKIDGTDGCYCSNCVKEIEHEYETRKRIGEYRISK